MSGPLTRWSCSPTYSSAVVEIDPIPGEPEYLAFAQAQDDDENVSGVQRITVLTGRLQELACFVDTPDAALTFPWCWQPDDGYRIAGDDLFLDRARESSAERGASVLTALRRQSPMAAFTDRATPSLGYRPGSVLPLRAALADTRELIDPLPDVLDLELVDSLLP